MAATKNQALKTAIKAKMRSLPKGSVNRYLDLYILTRKRTKLEQEMNALLKRKRLIDDELKDLDTEIRRLGKTISREESRRSSKPQARKDAGEFRTFVLDY